MMQGLIQAAAGAAHLHKVDAAHALAANAGRGHRRRIGHRAVEERVVAHPHARHRQSRLLVGCSEQRGSPFRWLKLNGDRLQLVEKAAA